MMLELQSFHNPEVSFIEDVTCEHNYIISRTSFASLMEDNHRLTAVGLGDQKLECKSGGHSACAVKAAQRGSVKSVLKEFLVCQYICHLCTEIIISDANLRIQDGKDIGQNGTAILSGVHSAQLNYISKKQLKTTTRKEVQKLFQLFSKQLSGPK